MFFVDMESVLFGGARVEGGGAAAKTDYLHELERINNELRGFVPIGRGGGDTGERDSSLCDETIASRVSTEAADSGLESSATPRMRISNGKIERDGVGDAIGNGEFILPHTPYLISSACKPSTSSSPSSSSSSSSTNQCVN